MNTCQNHFFVSVFRKFSHFSNYIFLFTASHSSSGKWNNTICTKLITSILYFDICSSMFRSFAKMHLFVFFRMVNVNHRFWNMVFQNFY